MEGSFTGAELEKRLNVMMEVQGCGGRPSKSIVRYAPFELRTCPCTFQNRASFCELWALFDPFERLGVLPFSGGLAEQPAKVVEAFSILRSLKQDYDLQQLKAANK